MYGGMSHEAFGARRHGWPLGHLVCHLRHPCLDMVLSLAFDVFTNVRRVTVCDVCRSILDVTDKDIHLCWVRRPTVPMDDLSDVCDCDGCGVPCHYGRPLCPLPCRNGRLSKHAYVRAGWLRRCKLGHHSRHPTQTFLWRCRPVSRRYHRWHVTNNMRMHAGMS